MCLRLMRRCSRMRCRRSFWPRQSIGRDGCDSVGRMAARRLGMALNHIPCEQAKANAGQRVIHPVRSQPTPHSMNIHLDPVIQRKLSAFAGRRRRLIVMRGVFAAVAMLLVTLLIVALVDYKWDLPE